MIAEAGSRRKAKLFSAATLAPNESKRRKVVEIMESCDIKLQGNGISCDELLTLAAVLGEAGIKALTKVKLIVMQLEGGASGLMCSNGSWPW